MQEAAKYIDHLQSNLICHIRTHGYPDRLKSFAAKSSYQDKDGIQTTLNSYLVGQGKRKWNQLTFTKKLKQFRAPQGVTLDWRKRDDRNFVAINGLF